MATIVFNKMALSATQPKLHSMFCALFLKIALSAAELMSFGQLGAATPLDYYLWGVVKDKCYADKPKTIDALKDNLRKAIGEIQLHTIENVLKNKTDRVSYCMASQGSHLNEIIFRKNCTFKQKKEISKNIRQIFLKHFPKKRYLADSTYIHNIHNWSLQPFSQDY